MIMAEKLLSTIKWRDLQVVPASVQIAEWQSTLRKAQDLFAARLEQMHHRIQWTLQLLSLTRHHFMMKIKQGQIFFLITDDLVF